MFLSRSPGLGVLAGCSRLIMWEQLFPRLVFENYCVIGPKLEVGVVNVD